MEFENSLYMVAKHVSPDAEINLVEAVAAGDFVQAEHDSAGLARMVELRQRYRGFPLGIADASVVALAEDLKATEVATLDHRHFRAVVPSHVAALTLLP